MESRMVRTCVVGACVSFALITLTVSTGARSTAKEGASAAEKDVIVINDAANPVPVTGTVVISAQAPVQRFQDLISANSPPGGDEDCETLPHIAGKVKIVQKIVIDANAPETLDGPNVYLLTVGQGNFLRTELSMVKRTDETGGIEDKWGGQVEGPLLAFGEFADTGRFVSICARNDAQARAFVVGVVEDLPTP